MCSKSLFKRIVPFFLTFAVGLFIASFFVTVGAPSFRFNKGLNRHREYHRAMEFENQRLREENWRLKAESQIKLDKFSGTFEMNEGGNIKRGVIAEVSVDADSLENLVPPPPPLPPPAPVKVIRR